MLLSATIEREASWKRTLKRSPALRFPNRRARSALFHPRLGFAQDTYGGLHGVRDENALESAIGAAYHTDPAHRRQVNELMQNRVSDKYYWILIIRLNQLLFNCFQTSTRAPLPPRDFAPTPYNPNRSTARFKRPRNGSARSLSPSPQGVRWRRLHGSLTIEYSAPDS